MSNDYEFAYICSECGHEMWQATPPVLGANECPKCGCGMTAAARREVLMR